MFLDIKTYKNAMIVNLKGELDHHTSTSTRNKIDRDFNDSNIQHIILDMREITFMDSSGIGLIMGRYQKVKSKNGRMIVVSDNKYVDRILKMSGLLKIIEFYPDIDLAKKNLEGGVING